jgi:hypothetical protein
VIERLQQVTIAMLHQMADSAYVAWAEINLSRDLIDLVSALCEPADLAEDLDC